MEFLVAGYEIIDTKRPILDIGISYGYDSAEGFTKAFARLVTTLSAPPFIVISPIVSNTFIAI